MEAIPCLLRMGDPTLLLASPRRHGPCASRQARRAGFRPTVRAFLFLTLGQNSCTRPIDGRGSGVRIGCMTLESIKNQRWVRRALWAIAVVLVVWALAWAVLPGLLQSQLSRLASEQLGREVRIGAVHLRHW